MHQLAAVLFAVAIAVIVFVALDARWYHHVATTESSTYSSQDEVWFSLKGYDNGRFYYTYQESEDFWLPVEPINTFMENISFLLKAGICFSAIWAGLVLLRLRRTALASGLAAAALMGVTTLAFFQGFGESMTESDLPGMYGTYTDFFVDKTTSYGSVHRDLWWPMLGWWLAIIACGVQSAGLGIVAFLERRGRSRKSPDTRPSRSP